MIISLKSPSAFNTEENSEALKSRLKEIGDQLRNRRALISAEIRNYPTPISRCDAQFNHLLEQQARLSRELERLDAIAAESPVREDLVQLIEDFIESFKSDAQE